MKQDIARKRQEMKKNPESGLADNVEDQQFSEKQLSEKQEEQDLPEYNSESEGEP